MGGPDDIGIQRRHDAERSETIRDFVIAGYPWADLSPKDKKKSKYLEMRKPGWLPTAIVCNAIGAKSKRLGRGVHADDRIRITGRGRQAKIILPQGIESEDWVERELRPLEIIDGQHRILSFSDASDLADFELPLVVFDDLDLSWQAYLFWSINITPKRITPSLAFDLYPLLRSEDWLEANEGPLAYREARAQELTEALWSHPQSPWYQRIGMLGRQKGLVTQAAFVRSLTMSFVKGSGRGHAQLGGLFTTPPPGADQPLPWSRAQQAAYLITLWTELEKAIANLSPSWAVHLANLATSSDITSNEADPFRGKYSLLNTDQGVRGFLQVANDLSYGLASELELDGWIRDRTKDATNIGEVDEALRDLRNPKGRTRRATRDFTRRFTREVAGFDWRSSATPDLEEADRNRQSLYRAGSGYREVRRRLLLHIDENGEDKELAAYAKVLILALGYQR